MSEQETIEKVKEYFSESYGTLNFMMGKMRESQDMYDGRQWTEKDASNSRKKNIPPLVKNFIRKNVNVVVGLQRQNKSALRCLPEGTEDNISASIASRLLHYTMRKGNGYVASAEAFKDQVTMGLSWITPYMDFSDDPVNGDLKIKMEPVFNKFFDPHTKEMDLSDCRYLINRQAVSKQMAKIMYPGKEKEIDSSNADYRSDYFVMEQSGLKNLCVIKELWERVLEPFYTLVIDGEMITIPQSAYNKSKDWIDLVKGNEGYAEMRHMKRVMKLTTILNDEVILFEGPSPYETDMFPSIPLFGFYSKSQEDWSMKLTGIVEALKDSQREINKWSANQMHYVLSSIHSGWKMDKNAVDDKRTLAKGMSTPIIEVNPGKMLDRIPPPQLPNAFIDMGQRAADDFMRLGLNADALGMQSGSESARLTKLRQVQGLATIGEITENFNFAFKQLGKMAIAMIFQFYTIDKIKRILGPEYDSLVDEHILKVKDIPFDIEVDDTTYSPVQKMIRLETKLEMQQYGVPGLEAEDFYDDLDLDAIDYVRLKERAEMRKQQEAEAAQKQQQIEEALTSAKIRGEESKADNFDAQSILMNQKSLQGAAEMAVKNADTENRQVVGYEEV